MLTRINSEEYGDLPTPTYYYNLGLLRQTLQEIVTTSFRYGFTIHYAIKANANHRILNEIAEFELGADCVSGNEIRRAIECGFSPKGIVFAGVGKTDSEIRYALKKEISCFHCESIQEMEVINQLAKACGKEALVALRINPDVDAKTHAHITTGSKENKFGMPVSDAIKAMELAFTMENVSISGLHFHIGSQITNLEVFRQLAERINHIQHTCFGNHVFSYLNVGGGLGIDYENPQLNLIPNFRQYFRIFAETLKLKQNQKVHFELGRSVVGQCGQLLTRVLYVKESASQTFAIVDAGMNDLLRPALYGARHFIKNISSRGIKKAYTVVGPICETTDSFGSNVLLSEVNRGDILVLYSTGAYGETMGSGYNLRDKTGKVFSEIPLELAAV